MLDTTELKSLAKELGADLAGVAPVERFENQPPEAHPNRISPDAKSVIVLGFRLPRGALRGPESGTAWSTASAGSPYTFSVETTYMLSRELERDGWEATPLIHQTAELRNSGVRVHPDKPEPNVIVDMEFAAHAAGLGEIGLGKFFLTPEFGPLQLFTAILTDAEYEGSPLFEGRICDECGECVAACPARALSADETQEAPLCEGVARWRAIRLESCNVCKTGPLQRPYAPDGDRVRVAAACGRACYAHLEATGALTRRFRHRFRDAAPVEG